MTFDEWFQTNFGSLHNYHDLLMKNPMRAAWEAATTAERERCAKVVGKMMSTFRTHGMYPEAFDFDAREPKK